MYSRWPNGQNQRRAPPPYPTQFYQNTANPGAVPFRCGSSNRQNPTQGYHPTVGGNYFANWSPHFNLRQPCWNPQGQPYLRNGPQNAFNNPSPTQTSNQLVPYYHGSVPTPASGQPLPALQYNSNSDTSQVLPQGSSRPTALDAVMAKILGTAATAGGARPYLNGTSAQRTAYGQAISPRQQQNHATKQLTSTVFDSTRGNTSSAEVNGTSAQGTVYGQNITSRQQQCLSKMQMSTTVLNGTQGNSSSVEVARPHVNGTSAQGTACRRAAAESSSAGNTQIASVNKTQHGLYPAEKPNHVCKKTWLVPTGNADKSMKRMTSTQGNFTSTEGNRQYVNGTSAPGTAGDQSKTPRQQRNNATKQFSTTVLDGTQGNTTSAQVNRPAVNGTSAQGTGCRSAVAQSSSAGNTQIDSIKKTQNILQNYAVYTLVNGQFVLRFNVNQPTKELTSTVSDGTQEDATSAEVCRLDVNGTSAQGTVYQQTVNPGQHHKPTKQLSTTVLDGAQGKATSAQVDSPYVNRTSAQGTACKSVVAQSSSAGNTQIDSVNKTQNGLQNYALYTLVNGQYVLCVNVNQPTKELTATVSDGTQKDATSAEVCRPDVNGTSAQGTVYHQTVNPGQHHQPTKQLSTTVLDGAQGNATSAQVDRPYVNGTSAQGTACRSAVAQSSSAGNTQMDSVNKTQNGLQNYALYTLVNGQYVLCVNVNQPTKELTSTVSDGTQKDATSAEVCRPDANGTSAQGKVYHQTINPGQHHQPTKQVSSTVFDVPVGNSPSLGGERPYVNGTSAQGTANDQTKTPTEWQYQQSHPLLTNLLLNESAQSTTKLNESNSTRAVAVVQPLSPICDLTPVAEKPNKATRRDRQDSVESESLPQTKRRPRTRQQSRKEAEKAAGKDLSFRTLTPQTPEEESGAKNNEPPIRTEPEISDLFSLPIEKWTIAGLSLLIETLEDKARNSRSQQKNNSSTEDLQSWNFDSCKKYYSFKKEFKEIYSEVTALLGKHLSKDTVVLLNTNLSMAEQLQNVQVLRDGEVYKEPPYVSSWSNQNEALDDIDKEFGPNFYYEWPSDKEPDPIKNVPDVSSRTVKTPGSQKVDEDSDDSLSLIEIHVLQPHEAKAIFEQSHKMAQSPESISQPKEVPDNLVEEPLQGLQAKRVSEDNLGALEAEPLLDLEVRSVTQDNCGALVEEPLQELQIQSATQDNCGTHVEEPLQDVQVKRLSEDNWGTLGTELLQDLEVRRVTQEHCCALVEKPLLDLHVRSVSNNNCGALVEEPLQDLHVKNVSRDNCDALVEEPLKDPQVQSVSNNNFVALVEEPLQDLQVQSVKTDNCGTLVQKTLQDLQISSIQQFCCFAKWKEIMLGCETSSHKKCQCTEDLSQKSEQIDYQEFSLVPETQFDSLEEDRESSSEETVTTDLPIITWLQIRNKVSETFEINDDSDEMEEQTEETEDVTKDEISNGDDLVIEISDEDPDDFDLPNLEPAEPCQSTENPDRGARTSPLEPKPQSGTKSKSLDDHTTLVDERKRKRPTIQNSIFPFLKKLMNKKKPDSDEVCALNDESVEGPDGKTTVPKKQTVQLSLFGSVPRQKRDCSYQGTAPPEVVYAKVDTKNKLPQSKPGTEAAKSTLSQSLLKFQTERTTVRQRRFSSGKDENLIAVQPAPITTEKNESRTTVPENVLKFNVLPESFNFQDDSGRNDTSECSSDDSSLQLETQNPCKKMRVDVWSRFLAQEPKCFLPQSAEVFAEYQKKYKERAKSSMTQ
ncbi:uncharacterized protein si:ch211-106e7.2 [Corythoichthys intestinalis]|uniref:uncharacterized protein si:ch211-106e7.2 n=1 Tax=Corythoichthys intestinalis TaxID=161448 RepID=UPI0025A600D3|nr:uncharacterized protein si:ch211-106e7.2 [Corythoichthys intestinalis]